MHMQRLIMTGSFRQPVRKTEEVPIELKVIGVDTLVEGEVDKEAADYLEKEVFLEKIAGRRTSDGSNE